MIATVWPRFSRRPRERRPDAAAAHDDDVHSRDHSLPRAGAAGIGSAGIDATPDRLRTDPSNITGVTPALGDIGKRLLLGRKLRSTQLGETLLPKRIALPVFASDALSSVAYAPDEIFLTLSLAGLAALRISWKIGLLVAFVMLVVVASYRQNVHAYPSGGGDYEVATVNLGPTAGLTVASALMVDYVLTVAVSISSGVQNAASALPFLAGHEVAAGGGRGGVADRDEPARRPRVGRGVRDPDVHLHGRRSSGWRSGASIRLTAREPAAGRERRASTSGREPGHEVFSGLAAGFLLAAGVLVRVCRADRCRGDQQRRAGVPQAEEQERGDHAAAARHDRGHDADEHPVPGQQDQAAVRRGSRRPSCSATANRSATATPRRPVIGQIGDSVFSNFPPGFYLVIGATMLILVLAANTAFNGFPVLGLDPGPGRLPAPAAAHPRRPARLQQRHHPAGAVRDRPDRRVRRRGDQADPALHRRRVRLVHAQPDRHDPALDPAAEDRDRRGQAPADDAVPGRSTRSA